MTKCGYCYFEGANERDLAKHCKVHHVEFLSQYPRRRFVCPGCNNGFPGSHLLNHFLKKHKNLCFWCMNSNRAGNAYHDRCIEELLGI